MLFSVVLRNFQSDILFCHSSTSVIDGSGFEPPMTDANIFITDAPAVPHIWVTKRQVLFYYAHAYNANKIRTITFYAISYTVYNIYSIAINKVLHRK